jgi:hypothetical protein
MALRLSVLTEGAHTRKALLAANVALSHERSGGTSSIPNR